MSTTSPVGECPLPAPVPAAFPHLLGEYRKILAAAWSDETIHPAYVPFRPAEPSQGQCGVSSAWLLRRLDREQRQRAEYCYGDIIFHDEPAETIRSHCWIEIGDASSADRLVIDLTSDQFAPRLPGPFLYKEHGSLMNRSIEYKAAKRMRFEELRDDAVWGRFKVLNRATRRARRKAFGAGLRWTMPFGGDRARRRQSVDSAVGSQSTEASAA